MLRRPLVSSTFATRPAIGPKCSATMCEQRESLSRETVWERRKLAAEVAAEEGPVMPPPLAAPTAAADLGGMLEGGEEEQDEACFPRTFQPALFFPSFLHFREALILLCPLSKSFFQQAHLQLGGDPRVTMMNRFH
jgi:hypothetical protein